MISPLFGKEFHKETRTLGNNLSTQISKALHQHGKAEKKMI